MYEDILANLVKNIFGITGEETSKWLVSCLKVTNRVIGKNGSGQKKTSNLHTQIKTVVLACKKYQFQCNFTEYKAPG